MCLLGCDSNSGSSTASQGVKQRPQNGNATGTSNGGTCTNCCPSFNIRSETVATQPSSRTRTRIGIGEEMNLSTDPSTSIRWSIVSDDGHKGTLSRSSGSVSKYTACDRAKSVTIKGRNSCGNEDTITFTVVEPSSGRFYPETDISQITSTIIRAGFTAPPSMMPNNVSFYNCDYREGVCIAYTSGIFIRNPNPEHEETSLWIPFSDTVSTNGTQLRGSDTVHGTRPLSLFPSGGITDGLFHWPIPWRVQVHNGGTNGEFVYDTLDHKLTYRASDRRIKMEKGNRSAQLSVP